MFYPVFYNWKSRELQAIKPKQKVLFNENFKFFASGSGQSIMFDVDCLKSPKKKFRGFWSRDKPQKLLLLYQCNIRGRFELISDQVVLNRSINSDDGQYGFFILAPGRFVLNTTSKVGKAVNHQLEFLLPNSNQVSKDQETTNNTLKPIDRKIPAVRYQLHNFE